MAKKVRFELNRAGVRDLMRGAEMSRVIEDAANRVASNATSISDGAAFDVESGVGRNRVYASVKPADAAAYYKTRRDNVMEKAQRSVTV